jgi:hypothetical protein
MDEEEEHSEEVRSYAIHGPPILDFDEDDDMSVEPQSQQPQWWEAEEEDQLPTRARSGYAFTHYSPNTVLLQQQQQQQQQEYESNSSSWEEHKDQKKEEEHSEDIHKAFTITSDFTVKKYALENSL